MAKFETDAIAENMRLVANYWDKNGAENRARVLRRWVEELDPPAIKCTYSGCDCDALFRVELYSHDDPGEVSFRFADHVSFRCGAHVAGWMMINAISGSIKVDLL